MISAEQITILLFGGAGVLFIAWYFFGAKEDATEYIGNKVNIKVDAGYSPSTFVVKKGKPVTLHLLRTDPSDCLDQLIIPQWNIIRALPLNKELTLTFTPKDAGEFPFHCGMNMFHGKIIVKD